MISYEIDTDNHDFHQPIQHQCYLSIERIESRQIQYTLSNGLLIPSDHVSRVSYSYSIPNETYPPQRTSTAMRIAESKLIVMVKILEISVNRTCRIGYPHNEHKPWE